MFYLFEYVAISANPFFFSKNRLFANIAKLNTANNSALKVQDFVITLPSQSLVSVYRAFHGSRVLAM